MTCTVGIEPGPLQRLRGAEPHRADLSGFYHLSKKKCKLSFFLKELVKVDRCLCARTEQTGYTVFGFGSVSSANQLLSSKHLQFEMLIGSKT